MVKLFPKPKTPLPYKNTLDEHRRRLNRLLEKRGVAPLKKLYEELEAELVHGLSSYGQAATTFSAQQHRIMLSEVRQGLKLMAKKLAGELGDISRDAQVESLRGLIGDTFNLERQFTGADMVLPIDEAGRFAGIVGGKRSILEDMHAKSMTAWAGSQIEDIEGELTKSLMLGENTYAAIDRVDKVTQGEWYQAERIARTEIAWSFNDAAQEGIKESASEFPDMMIRWVEYVSDEGEPLDNRVDVDSLIMHGQIVKPGASFYFPPQSAWPDLDLSDKDMEKVIKRCHRFGGKAWTAPPLRPNDRACVSPFRPHWGVSGWVLDNGKRKYVE